MPPVLGFHAGFPAADGPERLFDGRAPPARGFPVLVVKGRELPPSARGGLPEPNARVPVRPGPPVGRAPLGRSKEGRSKRGWSGLGRSGVGRSGLDRSVRGRNWLGRLWPVRPAAGPAPRNGDRPVAGRPVGGRLAVGRIGDSRSGSTASICSREGLGVLISSRSGAASRRGPA